MFGRKRQLRHGLLLDQPLDDGERCRSCQADCCRAFPSVELTAEEYDRLQQLGATRLEFTLDGHFYLLIEHGCEFLHNNHCGIYGQRPQICRRFTCQDDDHDTKR